MALLTVGDLLDWLLLSKPCTRPDIVSTAAAPPEDVATAIIALQSRKQIARTRIEGGTAWWKRGIADRHPTLLRQPIAGFHSRTHVHATNGEVLSWIDEVVLEAARGWAPRATSWGRKPSDSELAQAGIDGEAFLSSRLGRPPADREAELFWRQVEGCAPELWWIGPDSSPHRCVARKECCAGQPEAVPPASCAAGGQSHGRWGTRAQRRQT